MENVITNFKSGSVYKNKDFYMIYKYFWLIAILPKSLQFLVLFFMAAKVSLKKIWSNKQICLHHASFYFLLGIFIQIFAIINQIIIGNANFTRVLAAINTSLIWVFGIAFYEYYISFVFDSHQKKRLIKIIIINLYILFAIYIFSLMYKGTTISILGHSISLKRYDYFDKTRTYRFSGMLESQLSTAHLFLILMPIIIIAVGKNIHIFIVAILTYIVVLAGHSRVGMIMATVDIIAFIWLLLLHRNFNKRNIYQLSFFALLFLIILFICNHQKFIEFFLRLYNSREGSNSARFIIYKESISKVLQESPVFGIGIKYMISFSFNDIPYGSHSTYIGILYKSGILGCVFFMAGFYEIIKGIIKNCKIHKGFLFIIITVFSYFIFISLTDLDGCDWYPVFIFSSWGLLSNKSFVFEVPEDITSI